MDYSYEKLALANNYKYICGIDEVGRGPLAGDVYAGAVILPLDFEIEGINDSKKLTAKKREAMNEIILENAVSAGIGIVSVQEIDELNILNATYLAMTRAIENMPIAPDYCYIDGTSAPPSLTLPYSTIIKGDAKCISVAAASIVAKVARDKYMDEQHLLYPQYGFDHNKGYGTVKHINALKEHGSTPLHRKLFIRNFV